MYCACILGVVDYPHTYAQHYPQKLWITLGLIMVKCEKCKGEKFIMGLGYMREKCPQCSGKGFVSDDKVLVADDKVLVKKSKKE